jgi:hypothetical protein
LLQKLLLKPTKAVFEANESRCCNEKKPFYFCALQLTANQWVGKRTFENQKTWQLKMLL